MFTVRNQCPSGKRRGAAGAACSQTLTRVHPDTTMAPSPFRDSPPHASTGPCAHPDMHMYSRIIENVFSPGIIQPSGLEEAEGLLSTEK